MTFATENMQGTPVSGRCKLSWQNPADLSESGETTLEAVPSTQHTLTAINLTGGTTYEFWISADFDGDDRYLCTSFDPPGGDYYTATTDSPPTCFPNASQIAVTSTSSNMTVSWSTSESATCRLRYRPTQGGSNWSYTQGLTGTSHSFTVGTQCAQPYEYGIEYQCTGYVTAATGTHTTAGCGGGGDRGDIPALPALRVPHPNPTKGATRLAFELPEQSQVRIQVFDLQGKLIRNLVQGGQPAGYHVATWDGLDSSGNKVSDGIYFVRMITGKQRFAQRLLVIAKE